MASSATPRKAPALCFAYVWLSSLPFCLGFAFVPCVPCSISLAGFLTAQVSAPLCHLLCPSMSSRLHLHVLAGRGISGSPWSIVVPGLLTGVWLGSVGPDWLSCEGRRLRCHVGILYLVMGGSAIGQVFLSPCGAAIGQVFLSPCGGSCVEFCQPVVWFSQRSAFVLVVRRFSGTVGREGAGLPPRRFLAATAGLDQVRALRVADWYPCGWL